MREHAWRFVLGLVVGLALGAAAPVLAGISGGGGGAAVALTELVTDNIGANFTTTSVTFVAVTGLSAVATATANERWLIESRLLVRNTPGNMTATRQLVDGVNLLDSIKQEGNLEHGETNVFTLVSQALSSGSRTVSYEGLVSAGTGTWYFDLSGAADLDRCEVRVYALR